MTRILTSRGASLVRECSHFGRSTRWSGRCAPTWSGSSTLILPPCGIFKIVYSAILPAQAPIHPRFLRSRHRHPLHIKVQLMSAQVALSRRLRHGCPCPKTPRLFPARRSPPTVLLPPIPQRRRLTRHLLLLRHRYRRRRPRMRMDLDSSRLSRRIRAQLRLLSSPMATATDQVRFLRSLRRLLRRRRLLHRLWLPKSQRLRTVNLLTQRALSGNHLKVFLSGALPFFISPSLFQLFKWISVVLYLSYLPPLRSCCRLAKPYVTYMY